MKTKPCFVPYNNKEPLDQLSVSFVRLDSANGTISGYNHIVSSLVFRTLPINNDSKVINGNNTR